MTPSSSASPKPANTDVEKAATPPVPAVHPLADDLGRVVELRHHDPHHVLGFHVEGDAAVVRVFRPDADRVELVPDTGARVPMTPVRPGIFEAKLPGAGGKKEAFPYTVDVHYPSGQQFKLRDPYSFTPTLGDMDVYLAGQGRHERLWDRLGAHVMRHSGVSGTAFAVWAPSAAGVSVVGDFNGWDGRLHAMRMMGGSGLWELFVPDVGEGARYKFEIRPPHGGPPILKSDPFAFRTEVPPATASVVHCMANFRWADAGWMETRKGTDLTRRPVSIYEVHLASWRRHVEEGNRAFSYRELAEELGNYVLKMGFTHVELMPVAEHPYGGSWGYQVSGYYAPTARYGHPDDLRFLIDHLHALGIGVIVDWVPGHFPKDASALGRFDGTALYEHADPRQGEQPDWGTYVFNFGRNEVRNFLIANALFWIDQYHVDGLRVDAVASMLYLDYSRTPGNWVPNRWGGRENEEAIAFLRELNTLVREQHPGVVVIAEESTAWPKVSAPASEGGLGFHFKWNMGWMHDTLSYFEKDPVYRQFHHNQLTFGLLYAFSEHFILPLSHDEVVHGKGSLYGKMPGDDWQKRANLRSLFAWMWAHPGKKLLFQGQELGQHGEWNHDHSLDWHLLDQPEHAGIQRCLSDLNAMYKSYAQLFDADGEPGGFQWIQADSKESNFFAFLRRSRDGRTLVCAANMSPVVRRGYRMGFPEARRFKEVLNTDLDIYGGSGVGNAGGYVEAHAVPWDHQPASAEITLPPLGILWFVAD